jgi:hypothetical protein
MRRGGYPTKTEAAQVLSRVLECERAGVHLDDTETVAQYLTSWLDTKSQDLKPNTVLRYRDYINHDLIPAIGAVRLEHLSHEHVRQFIHNRLAGRGHVTLARCVTACPARSTTPSGAICMIPGSTLRPVLSAGLGGRAQA